VWLELNGITHNIYEHGSSTQRQLVFLHHFGGSGRTWNEVIAGLAGSGELDTDFRCFAPDLRGFGDTYAPATGYTLDDYADDVLALIANLNLDRYGLVGHSMGGKIALAVAARRPVGLQALLLVAPSPPTPEPMDDADRQRVLNGYGERGTALETINKITFRSLASPVLEQTIQDNVRSSHVAWQAWLEHGSREDIAARMAQIDTRTVVLGGQYDPVIPPQLCWQEIIARLPHHPPRFQMVRDVGHLIPLEAPQAIVNMLHGMLS